MSMYTYVYLTCDMIMTSEGGDFNMFFFVFVIILTLVQQLHVWLKRFSSCYPYLITATTLLLINYSGYLFVCVYLSFLLSL